MTFNDIAQLSLPIEKERFTVKHTDLKIDLTVVSLVLPTNTRL